MSTQVPTPEMIATWESDHFILRGMHDLRYDHHRRSWSMRSNQELFVTGGAVFRRQADEVDADVLSWGCIAYNGDGYKAYEDDLGATATMAEGINRLLTFYGVTTKQERTP